MKKKMLFLLVMLFVLMSFYGSSYSSAGSVNYINSAATPSSVPNYASNRRAFRQIMLKNLNQGNWEFIVEGNQAYDVFQAIKGTYYEALHLPIYYEHRYGSGESVQHYIRFGSADHTAEDDLRIRRNINDIVKRIVPKNAPTVKKARIIHDYIVLNYGYSYDQPSLKAMLEGGWANCNGYATMFLAMSDAAGVEAKYVKGDAYNGNRWEYHGWNEVKANGIWYGLDATWDDAYPNIEGYLAHDYFMVDYNTFYNSRTAH